MNISLLDICIRDLFSDSKELKDKYDPCTVDSILRIRDMYLWFIKSPSTKDAEFVKEDVGRYKVSRPTAYADLNIIKTILPNLSKANDEFNTWRFTQMVLETYNIAKSKKDVRTMERAVATFAKYMRLDKEIEEKLPLDKIIPQPFVPTEDPSGLGFKPIPNFREVRDRLLKKYMAEIPEVGDVEFEEIDITIPEDEEQISED